MSSPHHANLLQVLIISVVASIGGFLFGFDSGVINGTVEALQKAFNASDIGSGFNVASMLLGCAAGAFLAGALADKLGRRLVLLGTAVLFLVSAWGSGAAGNSAVFVIARLVGGFAVGAASILCPAYISEVAPARIRGALASLQQLAIVLGLFMAFVSNFLIAQAAGGASQGFWFGFQAWQWMFWMEVIPSVLFFAGLLLIPESPRFLVAAGRGREAEKVFQRLGMLEAEARENVREIEATLRAGHRPRMSDLYDPMAKRVHPIVWVGVALAAFQQFVGINVVFYYGEVLWRSAGFTEGQALLTNVITGAVNIGSTLVAMALIDRLGRKPLLIIGSAGMALMLGTMAAVFARAASGSAELKLEGGAALTALLAANLYVVFFAISWGPVMWVMLGEMFKNQFRGAALSVSGFSQWMSNFTVTMTFPWLLRNLGLGAAYGLYTAFAAASLCFVVWCVRETKGKTLEEM